MVENHLQLFSLFAMYFYAYLSWYLYLLIWNAEKCPVVIMKRTNNNQIKYEIITMLVILLLLLLLINSCTKVKETYFFTITELWK